MAEESPPDTVLPPCDRPPSGRVPKVQPSTSADRHLGAPVSPCPPLEVWKTFPAARDRSLPEFVKCCTPPETGQSKPIEVLTGLVDITVSHT